MSPHLGSLVGETGALLYSPPFAAAPAVASLRQVPASVRHRSAGGKRRA